MSAADTSNGSAVVSALVEVIVDNRTYLSEVDGAIGDGDHGINMAKGFRQCGDAIAGRSMHLAEALETLSDILMDDIGGSMGPLYGSLFMGMSEAVEGRNTIDAEVFASMLEEAIESIRLVSDANVGDKCLMDTLVPAAQAARAGVDAQRSLRAVIAETREAAEEGMESTRNLVSRIGRSARLGERSRGALDAGAVSTCLLITCLSDELDRLST